MRQRIYSTMWNKHRNSAVKSVEVVADKIVALDPHHYKVKQAFRQLNKVIKILKEIETK